MQPLDYLFIYLLAVFGAYTVGKFWYDYVRTNKKTTDDLTERYVALERYRSKHVDRIKRTKNV